MGRQKRQGHPDAPAHAALIDALGGTVAVAKLVGDANGMGYTPQAVTRWRTYGISWKYRPVLVSAVEAANEQRRQAGEPPIAVPPAFTLA